MTNLKESLLAFQNNPSHHSEVFRLLIGHPLWYIPAREGQPLLQQIEQGNHLHIYSSKEHLTAHNHPEIGSIKFTSTWLFANLPPVDSIIIDGHADHALQILTSLFTSLVRMNRAKKIEHILAAQSNDDNFMVALKDFDAYYLPLVQDSEWTKPRSSHQIINSVPLLLCLRPKTQPNALYKQPPKKLNNLQMDIVSGENYFTISTCFLSREWY